MFFGKEAIMKLSIYTLKVTREGVKYMKVSVSVFSGPITCAGLIGLQWDVTEDRLFEAAIQAHSLARDVQFTMEGVGHEVEVADELSDGIIKLHDHLKAEFEK